MIRIDGTMGEGGGQVFRTSVALSALTGKPFAITRIRGGRGKPGLLRQHLTAVRAAAEICSAKVKGAELGSGELEFRPGEVRSGAYEFAIGSAGSTSLVLQTILYPLAAADGASTVVITGGTHNKAAPTFEFLRDTFAPQLARTGPLLAVELDVAGYYPAGGGVLRARIEPGRSREPFELLERGEITRRAVEATVAHLPDSVGRREIAQFCQRLTWPEGDGVVREDRHSPGPGNVLTVQIGAGGVTETFVGFGERGVRAENVANDVAKEVKNYLAVGAPVGVHLADQLILPMALAAGGTFRTVAPSKHLLTQVELIPRFLDVEVSVEPEPEGKAWVVAVRR